MVFAAKLFDDEANVFSINWFRLIVLAAALAISAFLFVRKDYLRMEYDYILQGNVLTICAIMNRRRRKRLLSLKLSDVLQAGAASESTFAALQGSSSVRRHKWYASACHHYIAYTQDCIRHVALLELDETLLHLIRRQLPAGVWHDEEGKKNNASISG